MTLVQLRHLTSLAKTGSFSQSAAALFLTQPALSRSIRALETEFGFERADAAAQGRLRQEQGGGRLAERAGLCQ